MGVSSLDLAFELATRPRFDSLHDPNPATGLIEPYHDPVGFPTQGYGRLLSRVKWEDLSKYPAITPEQAKADALVDLRKAARSAHSLTSAPLQPHQWAAIYDFCFNAGGGNYQISTLRAVINRGEHDRVEPELKRWVFAGAVKLAGLVRRRDAEATMFNKGI